MQWLQNKDIMQILKFKSSHIGYQGQAFTINDIVRRPNVLKNNEKEKLFIFIHSYPQS